MTVRASEPPASSHYVGFIEVVALGQFLNLSISGVAPIELDLGAALGLNATTLGLLFGINATTFL